MAPRTLVYPKKGESTVKRYNDRATYDVRTIHTIVNTTPVVHVSFTPDPDQPFPAILPMIGQMGSYTRPSADLGDPLDCYLHGYVSSRLMNLSRQSPKGLPVCIAATKVDGLVLSLTPNSHSYNYRSAVLFGYATPVTDVEEKLWAMELVTNSVLHGRWKDTRVPPDGGEMSSTQILRVKIDSGSGKIRQGWPHDKKEDTGDEEIVGRVWTGVVPVIEKYGDPIPGPLNRVEEVPTYIRDFVDGVNGRNEGYVAESCREPVGAKKKEGLEEDD